MFGIYIFFYVFEQIKLLIDLGKVEFFFDCFFCFSVWFLIYFYYIIQENFIKGKLDNIFIIEIFSSFLVIFRVNKFQDFKIFVLFF